MLHLHADERPRDRDTLPCDDGEPLETDKHRLQMNLLIDTLKPELEARGTPAYVSGNSFLYYARSVDGRPPRFVGPDFYAVLDQTPELRPCYVVWEEEGKLPHVIIELTSKSTEKLDRGSKLMLYRDVFRTPEYFIFDPITLQLEGFSLQNGSYEPIQPDPTGRWHSRVLALNLRVEGEWLRWFRPDGSRLSTAQELYLRADERAHQESERADQESQRADQESQRAERLAQRLRELGIDPSD